MRVVAVVPMKLNNVRLPQKNTRSFINGKPLCQYILHTLLECTGIDKVYVYCSNPGIQEYLIPGIEYLSRGELLDRDITTMNEVLKAFASDVDADIYVMAHTTAPFLSRQAIEKGIRAVAAGNYDSAFSVKKVQDFIWKDGMPFNYELDRIPRTQDLPPLYMETSGFYIYNAAVIHEMGRRIGEKPYLVEVGEIESCDIDEEEDFVIADAIYNYWRMEKKNEL